MLFKKIISDFTNNDVLADDFIAIAKKQKKDNPSKASADDLITALQRDGPSHIRFEGFADTVPGFQDCQFAYILETDKKLTKNTGVTSK